MKRENQLVSKGSRNGGQTVQILRKVIQRVIAMRERPAAVMVPAHNARSLAALFRTYGFQARCRGNTVAGVLAGRSWSITVLQWQ